MLIRSRRLKLEATEQLHHDINVERRQRPVVGLKTKDVKKKAESSNALHLLALGFIVVGAVMGI